MYYVCLLFYSVNYIRKYVRIEYFVVKKLFIGLCNCIGVFYRWGWEMVFFKIEYYMIYIKIEVNVFW